MVVRTGFLARGRVESGASRKEVGITQRSERPKGIRGFERSGGLVQRQDIKKSEEIGQVGKGLEARLKI